MSAQADQKSALEDPHCLMRSVASAFAAEPSLEAITLDKAEQTISVATLGKAPDARLAERIRAKVRAAQTHTDETHCTLWEGTLDCSACATPLSPAERTRIRIEHKNGKTTIARVTCPTAPRF